jgi:predicted house-cleaning noncanonical NTP pyrophosphatase (MazG superfamily)
LPRYLFIYAEALKTKQDFKILTDDFKERLDAAHSKAVEDHDAHVAAQMAEKSTFQDLKACSGIRSASETPRLSLPLIDERKGKDSADTDVEEQEKAYEEVSEPIESKESEDLKNQIAVVVREADSDGTITEEEIAKPPPRSKRAVKRPARKAAPKR